MRRLLQEKRWGTPPGGYRFGEFARQFRPTKLRRQLLHLQPFRSTLRRNLRYSLQSGLEGIRKQLKGVLSSMDAGGYPLLEGVPVGAPWGDDVVLDAAMFYERMIDDEGATPEQAYMRLVSMKEDVGQVPPIPGLGGLDLGGPVVEPQDFPQGVVIGGRVHSMPFSWLRERGPMTQHFLLNLMMDGYDVPDIPFPDDPAWNIADMADLLRDNYIRVADRLERPGKDEPPILAPRPRSSRGAERED